MKKVFLCLMVLCLCIVLSAEAETTVVSREIKARNMSLNEAANTLIVQNEDRTYQVMDAEGNMLSDAYRDMNLRNGFFRVANEDGINNLGLLDGKGQLIIPPEYGDVDVLSDLWQYAVVLTEATSENYDYKAFGGKGFYLIDHVDIYYRGGKAGSLNRMEWKSASVYGDYLRVQNRDGNYVFYNREMQPSAREANGGSEYDEDYRNKIIWHQGSGQQAFTSSCTLTPEEVVQDLRVEKGSVLDLQGNVIGDVSAYKSASAPVEGYIKVRNGADLYGVTDRNGREILPCAYDMLLTDYRGTAETGYVYAEKGGKGGYVNLETGEEAGFIYSKDAIDTRYACYAKVNDLDGSIIVISAAVGKLPVQYKELRSYYATRGIHHRMAIVQDMQDRAGVIGLLGEEIVPLDGTFTSAYDLSISNDGSLILGRQNYGSYILYQVHYDPDLSAGIAAAASQEEGWTCVNGHAGNTGKYCPECGAPKGAESVWTCGNGHTGNTGNFCPECGLAR